METFSIIAKGLRLTGIAAGHGPLVLMLHGFPETAQAWHAQVEALGGAGYRALALNLPGFADSTRPLFYRLDALVDILVAVLDALGEEAFTIVGNDWGATIAWTAAQLRPDRFRAVLAIGVPMMGRPSVPPSQIFPQTEEALFYTLYFQEPGVAEAEFEDNIALTLRKIIHAASAEAGLRQLGDGTPNPFAMVIKRAGLLAALPDRGLPAWLSLTAFDDWVAAYRFSGFGGPLGLYRSLDENWQALPEGRIDVPAAFLMGDRDPGRSMPGMDQIVAAMPALVPQLAFSDLVADCGHWVPQEQPVAVIEKLLGFLKGLMRA